MKILALLALASCLLSACASGPAAAYQSTVASRKISAAGTYDKDSGAAGGQISDEVFYR